MTEQSLVKTVSYEVRGTNLDEVRSDDPRVDVSLNEVASLVQFVRDKRAKIPASAPMLEKSQVPPSPGTMRDDCYYCSYTKVVNFIVVENFPNPRTQNVTSVEYYEDGSRGCGDCGFFIRVSTHIKNQFVVEEITELWEQIHRPLPQP